MPRFLKLFFAVFISPLTVFAQANQLYVNYSNGGLCSSSIRLNNDGTYDFEHGCEASSHVSFGTWIQKKDTIKLTQIDTKNLRVLKIVPSNAANAKTLSVKLFDQAGQNITEKIRVGQYVKGKGTYTMALDSTKTNRTDFLRDSGIILLGSLQSLLNQPAEIKAGSYTNFEITLNIPGDWIYKINSNWTNTGNFELLKTKNALITIDRFIDEHGNLTRTAYKKYP